MCTTCYIMCCCCYLCTPAVQRLPQDFEPFFAVNRKARRLDGDSTSSVSTTQDGIGTGLGHRVTGLAFRILFAVFSSRHWDRLYLLLALSWAVLCPGYMDGAIAVERAQLALLLLIMFVVAGAPALLAVVLKVFFSIRLRSRLLHNDRRRFVVRNEQDRSGSFYLLNVYTHMLPEISRISIITSFFFFQFRPVYMLVLLSWTSALIVVETPHVVSKGLTTYD